MQGASARFSGRIGCSKLYPLASRVFREDKINRIRSCNSAAQDELTSRSAGSIIAPESRSHLEWVAVVFRLQAHHDGSLQQRLKEEERSSCYESLRIDRTKFSAAVMLNPNQNSSSS